MEIEVESEEAIRANMERTRESLTEKLEALEDKLVGTVEDATTAVRETVTSVKDTMHEGVESVKEAVDIQAHVQKHPWFMFGGAILGGYVVSSLIQPEKSTRPRGFTLTPARSSTTEDRGPTSSANQQSSSPSWTAGLLQAFEPEMRHLKGLALGVALGAVREMLTKEVPPHFADQLRGIIDDVTRKVGGEPVAAQDLPFNPAASSGSACGSAGSS